MRAILEKQSELSLASAVFYFAGALFAFLSVSVFPNPQRHGSVLLLLMLPACLVVSATMLILGRRLRRVPALALMSVAAGAVLYLAFTTPTAITAMNQGLLFFTILLYLVWFGPMWFARVLGYEWVALYTVAVAVRFGEQSYPVLATFVVTTVAMAELIGMFKNRMEATSLTDPLCGVWNKRGFAAVIERATMTIRRTGQPLSVLYIDLDDLKHLNDTYGHHEGDRVLRSFAAEIDRTTRAQDSVARLGGDEFAVLLLGADADVAQALGQRLREQVTLTSWSFGVAQMQPGESPDDFIIRADRMMLEDKRHRKAARAARSAAER